MDAGNEEASRVLVVPMFPVSFLSAFAAKQNDENKAADEEWEIAYVAKLIGLPCFNMTGEGMLDAATGQKVWNGIVSACRGGAPQLIR